MSEGRATVRYQILLPLVGVKLEEHPGSRLRRPTNDLVEIPAGVTVELEGSVPPAGLVTVIWEGLAFSVFYEDLREKARIASAHTGS